MNWLGVIVLALIALCVGVAVSTAHADQQCVTLDQAQEINCAGWKPIWPHDGEKLPGYIWQAIKDHDDRGVRMGCWKYPQ